MFRRLVRGSLLAGLLVLTSVSAEGAGPPSRFSYDTGVVPTDFWSDLCGVPIGYCTRGTAQSVALDDGGFRVSTRSEEVFTNLMTGRSVALETNTHGRGTFEPWFDEWGGQGWIFTYVVTGAPLRLVIPGQGAVTIRAGRMTQTMVIDSLGQTIAEDTDLVGRVEDVPPDFVALIVAGLLR